MSRLNFRGHVARRDYAANIVAPAVLGSVINGQTLNGTTGTWTSGESLITSYAYQWQTASAPDFADWVDLSSATAINLMLTSGKIGQKLRFGVAAINGDGQAPFVYSAPTAIVQDAPAIPLAITGSPLVAANQGDPASFIVSFDGGLGTYSATLLNVPAGSSVTILSSGDQAIVTLSTSSPGSYGGIIVRVSDSATTADLVSFTFTVNSVGSIQTVIPGTGWTGLTTTVNGIDVTARCGSSLNVGYNFTATCFYEEPPFFDLDSPYILWIHAYHTGPSGDFDTNHPAFGIDHVTVAADGGSWLTITAQYNSADNFWGFPVRIDPSKWADGYPTLGTSSVRTLRIVAWPKNGKPRVIQAEPPDFWQAFRFTTNANGTFTRTKRYFGSNGSAANDGLSAATPKSTMEQAAATFTPAALRDYGDLELVCTGGTALSLSLNARPTTVRPLKVSALPGLTSSDCIFTAQGVGGLNTKLSQYKDVGLNLIVNAPSGSSLYFENAALDGGSSNLSQDVTYHSAAATGGVWIRGGSVTNFGNAFRGTRSAANVTVGLISRNFIQNALIVRGVALASIPASSGVHPDTFQYYRTPTGVAGTGWTYGAIAINVTVASADAQGPFFKDNNFISGIFMVNCNFTLTNANRNTWVIGVNTFTNPTYPYTILQNSMFWNCSFLGGLSGRGSGTCEDVIWKNVNVPGVAPTGAIVFEASH